MRARVRAAVAAVPSARHYWRVFPQGGVCGLVGRRYDLIMVFSRKAASRAHRRTLVVVSAAVAAVVGACGSSDPVHTWAAKVDGAEISSADLMADLRATQDNPQFQELLAQGQSTSDIAPAERGTSSASLTAVLLSQRIVTQVAAREAQKLGVKVEPASDELRARVEESWGGTAVFNGFDEEFQNAQLRSSAIQSALVDAIAPPEPTAADIAQYVSEHADELAAEAPVCARHILVDSKSDAEAIMAELAAGADFAQIAQTRSTDTGSGAQGGDLGCSAPSSYVEAFANAVAAAPVGQVVGPVETEFGFHVILVTERQTLSQADAEQLAAQALSSDTSSVLDQWFADVLDRAEIAVNPRFGSWSVRDGAYTVVPPGSV